MKKFEFPLNIPSLYLYIGEDEWGDYINKCIDNGVEFEPEDTEVPGKGEGRMSHNAIWLEELEFSLMFHELMHFLDFTFMVKGIHTELEYKADIANMVNTAVVQWSIEEGVI